MRSSGSPRQCVVPHPCTSPWPFMIQPAELKALHLQSSLVTGWWHKIYGVFPPSTSKGRPDKSERQVTRVKRHCSIQATISSAHINHSVTIRWRIWCSELIFSQQPCEGLLIWAPESIQLTQWIGRCLGPVSLLVGNLCGLSLPSHCNTRNFAYSLQMERRGYSWEITNHLVSVDSGVWRIEATCCFFLKHGDEVFRIHLRFQGKPEFFFGQDCSCQGPLQLTKPEQSPGHSIHSLVQQIFIKLNNVTCPVGMTMHRTDRTPGPLGTYILLEGKKRISELYILLERW